MTNKLLSLLAFLIILLTTVDASVISTGVFNILKGTDPQNLVDITWELHSDNDEFKFYIINNSTEGVVTGVYFEESLGYITGLEALSTPTTTFHPDKIPKQLKGGGNIAFTVDYSFDAAKPNKRHGIDVGEVFCFRIEDFDTTRIGIDVTGVGTYNTNYVVRSIPEPTIPTLLGLVGIGLTLRRRKNKQ